MHISNPTSLHSLHIIGGFNVFKIDENEGGGVWNFLLEKKGGGGVRQNGRVGLEMGRVSYYIEVFLEVPHDAA